MKFQSKRSESAPQYFSSLEIKQSNVKNHRISKHTDRHITSIIRWNRVYLNIFRYHQMPKTSRIYISRKIESARSIAELKYGNKNNMPNIFNTLVTNSAFSFHSKLLSNKEHSIGFFTQIIPHIILRDTLCGTLQ